LRSSVSDFWLFRFGQLGAAFAVLGVGAGLDTFGFLLRLLQYLFRFAPGLGDHLGGPSLRQAYLPVENDTP
jgi:hypothetical protein